MCFEEEKQTLPSKPPAVLNSEKLQSKEERMFPPSTHRSSERETKAKQDFVNYFNQAMDRGINLLGCAFRDKGGNRELH